MRARLHLPLIEHSAALSEQCDGGIHSMGHSLTGAISPLPQHYRDCARARNARNDTPAWHGMAWQRFPPAAPSLCARTAMSRFVVSTRTSRSVGAKAARGSAEASASASAAGTPASGRLGHTSVTSASRRAASARASTARRVVAVSASALHRQTNSVKLSSVAGCGLARDYSGTPTQAGQSKRRQCRGLL